MIYQHPLAYLLGLEGIALLRAWAGDFDQDFVVARLAEVRQLLDDETLVHHPGVNVARGDTATGYRQWSATYDEPRNTLFDVDEPVVHEIVDAFPVGLALDAACGTGRYAAHLVGQGHRVIGIDSSPEMLAVAAARVPEAEFRLGDLHDLPAENDAFDFIVCALALAHVPTLQPVMAEFARVLRPNGHLVISDTHHDLILRGSVVKALGPNGEPGLVATYRHTPGDFLRAALAAGFQVRRCDEPRAQRFDDTPPPPSATFSAGSWDTWPWSMLDLIPAASRAAWDIPATIVWHFQLSESRSK